MTLFSLSGCPDEVKKAMVENKPQLEISKDGDTYVFKVTAGTQVKETRFKPGEQFEGVSITFQPMKVSFSG